MSLSIVQTQIEYITKSAPSWVLGDFVVPISAHHWNQCTTLSMWGVIMTETVFKWGWGAQDMSLPFAQFCCELPTALKTSLLKKRVLGVQMLAASDHC